jgi:hypothetical protein
LANQLIEQAAYTGVETIPGGSRIHKYRQTKTITLNPNLMGVGWLRTHLRAMPMSALFLPDQLRPQLP